MQHEVLILSPHVIDDTLITKAERLLNLQEMYISGQNICIEVYGKSVDTLTPEGRDIPDKEETHTVKLRSHHLNGMPLTARLYIFYF